MKETAAQQTHTIEYRRTAVQLNVLLRSWRNQLASCLRDSCYGEVAGFRYRASRLCNIKFTSEFVHRLPRQKYIYIYFKMFKRMFGKKKKIVKANRRESNGKDGNALNAGRTSR